MDMFGTFGKVRKNWKLVSFSLVGGRWSRQTSGKGSGFKEQA
jgi:hypothetical protein